MANVITNDNIRDLVRDYIEDRGRLPAWLRNIPIGDWDVSRVTDMSSLFENFNTFNEDLSNWDVSRVRDMGSMFSGCTNFNQPLNGWNVSNVTNMPSMFSNCVNFNQSLNNWNVSSVRNMVYMFSDCVNFNQPLNNWNVSQLVEARYMFENCRSFNQDLSNWNITRLRSMMYMFRGCTSLTINPNWQINPMLNNIQTMFVNTPLEGTILQAERPAAAARAAAERPVARAAAERPAARAAAEEDEPPIIAYADGRITLDEVIRLSRNQPQQLQQLIAFARGAITAEQLLQLAIHEHNQMRQQQPRQQAPQPQGLAYEVHNAFADLDLPKFMTIIRRENNGDSNFKDNNNILEPIVSYINGPDTSLSSEQKTRYTTNFRKMRGIIQNVNEYIRGHPEVKANTLEVIQFVLSQEPNYKDLYIETFENECMGGYSSGDRQSCTKGMFERIYMANKGTIEGLCFEELQRGASTSAASASAASAAPNACNPVYLELYKAFTPGADIDINDIFQKWYNQFSYDAIPEGENPLTNLSVDARKRHFRNFVRQDEIMTRRIWTDREFQRKLEQSIQANNIIFETLTLDVGLGRRKRKRRTVKHIFSDIEKKKKKQKNVTMKKQRKNTMKYLKRNVRKTKEKY